MISQRDIKGKTTAITGQVLLNRHSKEEGGEEGGKEEEEEEGQWDIWKCS
jgi:hypothetical protein